ncbi:hypothetical protein C1H46_034511 [Malus baccata]|uniref:DUF962 domain-containing protein n=1 Tax=Malus baccata TaxID=106549 RepID=A0A540L0F2_MALBA|nr:hypothetical protein C1H46_034511 [Malus baccata]
MGRTGLFDLESHFAFYGAYHSNPVNILIHTLFVWPIFFTSLVLFYFTPSLYNFPNGFCLNLGFAFTVIYAGFYVCLDKKAGSVAALLCVLCWVQSTLLASRLGFSLSWKVRVKHLWVRSFDSFVDQFNLASSWLCSGFFALIS